ncbi:hypothetical protein [Candidatus Marinarcus aquaticus]|uniref:Cell division protein ZapB n=1 Tax=Candidatus Marinarcus aquaticus TaxID=2044504 RepID=A0A4Q0XV46_9BACT|nr:hypothetical protein [Candidatus Marinarcus aquaticus]RXJ60855.1 hypothetical protein CRV04_02240 [Candidatus Marinarcus aquaticus]
MDIIQKLNAQVEKINKEFEALKYENDSLKRQVEELKNRNDEHVRNSQDLLLKIDSTLALKGKGN